MQGGPQLHATVCVLSEMAAHWWGSVPLTVTALPLYADPLIQQCQLEVLASGRINEQRKLPQCDGCGKQAIGLRRCSRCRIASYCS